MPFANNYPPPHAFRPLYSKFAFQTFPPRITWVRRCSQLGVYSTENANENQWSCLRAKWGGGSIHALIFTAVHDERYEIPELWHQPRQWHRKIKNNDIRDINFFKQGCCCCLPFSFIYIILVCVCCGLVSAQRRRKEAERWDKNI